MKDGTRRPAILLIPPRMCRYQSFWELARGVTTEDVRRWHEARPKMRDSGKSWMEIAGACPPVARGRCLARGFGPSLSYLQCCLQRGLTLRDVEKTVP